MSTTWIRKPEVPYDDGTPTGRYYWHEYRIIGTDPLTGEHELADEPERIIGPSRTRPRVAIPRKRGGR